MIKSLVNKKFTISLLLTLFFLAFIEIIIYFFYIYKPASQIFSSAKSYPLEIPTLSQLLKPPQITNTNMTLEDLPQTIDFGRIDNVKSLLTAKLTTRNTFIKSADADYILAGEISSVDLKPNGDITVNLTNSSGAKISEAFTEEGLKKTKLFVYVLSPTNPSRNESSLKMAIPGDYLIIKYTYNLLSRGDPTATDMEIFRNENPGSNPSEENLGK
jgi:hypothetical protein